MLTKKASKQSKSHTTHPAAYRKKKGILKRSGKRDGLARGMDLDREEGYTLAKQGFDGIIKGLKDREDSKKISTSNSGMQMNPTTVPAVSQAQMFVENMVGTHLLATAAVLVQTCPHIICSPSTSAHTQTESPALTTDATPFKNGRKPSKIGTTSEIC